MSKKRFADKVVLITGASGGIGRASAVDFAKEGAKLAIVSRSKEKLDKVAEEIKPYTSELLVVPTDVSDQHQVNEMVSKVISKYGAIDYLFNNAGSSYVGGVEKADFVENVKKMFEVDYLGSVYTTQAVIPYMRKQGSGHIMNMSSVVGRKAFPKFGGYSSIMHAITGFSAALRQELRGSGIHVSTIHPALTQTNLLDHVNPDDMPPPFKNMTPMPVEKVSKAVLDGFHYNHTRIVVPFQPKLVLFWDAVSPAIGDLFVRLLSKRYFSRMIGMYKGSLYQHDTAA
ncbi:MAG: SDR family oxidoreductase [Candidatus Dadabacteria bacterium]|nr:SDR family oxidoreductase [Candidatus Dadabacteria bacterium]NIS09791.1 SDR family oxidoreductase [Candidatus Dadabacteria bacterium]NIV41147.1 SDR family NAD(P)-dependent oxidoreductase [Candidatus Dadabacteria bacterium]NIX16232.1 SDR family NAD(P)-dependent oxidoreductase [Candidatus Dadabacteria bacterium]NIY22852.1 SDR family NAD(P)-dependent oxidoreductase [Candidatus Dadabacteria bacterium]